MLFFLLYLITGDRAHGDRARGFWTVSRVLILAGINILIWGHVLVALWQIWFR